MGAPCTNCIDVSNMGKGKCDPVKTNNIVYTGPDMACSGIETNDDLTLILQKIDEKICNAPGGQNLQTTLGIGNTAEDIGAIFTSPSNPSLFTEILFDRVTTGYFVRIGGLSTQYLMANGAVSTITDISNQLITQSITDGNTGQAPSSDAVYDAIQTLAGGVLFDADIPVVLSGVKTLGKYVSGQTIPAIGKTAQQVLTDIALEYVNPVFTSFSVSGQPTTVEVGTTLSGLKTFTWGITVNSGVIPTIDLYDNTGGATLLAGTPNDGTEPQTVTTIQLNGDGSIQSWKGIGNNTSPPGIINSGNFVVTSRYLRFWAPVAAYPVNPVDGAANRTYALALSNAFKTPGGNTFLMPTGTIQNRFIVLLPPGVTLVSVIDLTNANTNITTSFILSAITINDVGGTARNYNMYQYTNAIPYTTSANLSITTT